MHRVGLASAVLVLAISAVANAATVEGRKPLSPQAEEAHHQRNSICHKDWRAACGMVAKGHERHVCVRQHVLSYSPECQAAMKTYTAVRRASR